MPMAATSAKLLVVESSNAVLLRLFDASRVPKV
jgi:hypothetical protein